MTAGEVEAIRVIVNRSFRDLETAQRASTKASEARAALPAGSSRAKVTTANARWMRASEERDRKEDALVQALRNAIGALGSDL